MVPIPLYDSRFASSMRLATGRLKRPLSRRRTVRAGTDQYLLPRRKPRVNGTVTDSLFSDKSLGIWLLHSPGTADER